MAIFYTLNQTIDIVATSYPELFTLIYYTAGHQHYFERIYSVDDIPQFNLERW